MSRSQTQLWNSPISKTAEPLLPRCIPHVEFQLTAVCVEGQGVHFHAESRDLMAGSCASHREICTDDHSAIHTYFFSNSPVKCRFTKVVFPTPPSPTKMSLNSGTNPPTAAACESRHRGQKGQEEGKEQNHNGGTRGQKSSRPKEAPKNPTRRLAGAMCECKRPIWSRSPSAKAAGSFPAPACHLLRGKGRRGGKLSVRGKHAHDFDARVRTPALPELHAVAPRREKRQI